MHSPSALAASPAVEGAFVFGAYNIMTTVCGGPAASLRAGLHGVAMGRFAWMAPTGICLNVRLSVADLLGLVLPQYGPGIDWRRVFYDDVTQTFRIREGLPVTLLAKGNVWARFKYGATIGDPVYASLIDGSAISGYSADDELTPWSVVSTARPGELAIISTWSMYA